ncbi:homeodomain-like protein [Tanacetum coccineum]|uniref:Homeodomain-like protein n=1 Tax=Tanacetum coccineum TaxID=301880 RepID=A0ABQ5F573_9ASTR
MVSDRRVEYGVSNPTEYGVSSSLSNTAYSSQQINTAYPLPLDTAYRSSGTETKIIDFRAKIFLPSFGTNPTDCLSLVSGQFLKELRENTFSGSDNKDANEHIEKVLKIVDLFNVPNITHNGTSRGRSTETSDGLAAIQAQLNNLRREIKKVNEKVYAAQVGFEISKGIAENVLVGIGKFTFPIDFIILDMPEDVKVPLILGRPFFLRERMELDLEARLMGETLVLNRSLNPFLEDYIELNYLNEPFELRRNQGDDLMPTIEEGEVIEEFKTRDDELDTGIDDYPSYCDLKFSCMIGFEFTHANFFPLLYVNVMSKKFHNSITKDKMVYKGNNVVGALMNIPIFVGTFFVMTDFVVLEDMDTYRDDGMGDVSEKDEKNRISYAYQKLKGFYKGVLNLGPDYIQNAKTEEWITRGHISVHEME